MVSESLRGVVSQQLVPNAQRDGMELALEIMVNTTAIANLIREDRAFQIGGTIQTGKKWGMRLMDESLISLAKEGRIRREDAVVRATNRALVKRELNV
jgi:twitching motility protein PilT